MNGPHFFQTRMGVTFFEGTVPRLVRAIQALVAPPPKVEYTVLIYTDHESLGKALAIGADQGFRFSSTTENAEGVGRLLIMERVRVIEGT